MADGGGRELKMNAAETVWNMIMEILAMQLTAESNVNLRYLHGRITW